MAHLRRWITLLTAASSALAALHTRAEAQYPGELIPYIVDVGGGWVSPQGAFGHRATTGYHLPVGFGIESRRALLGIRFEAMYDGFEARPNYIATLPQATLGLASIWGFLGNIVVGRPAGRGVRPYIIGGGGVYSRATEIWRNPASGVTNDDPAWGFVNVTPAAAVTRFTDTDNAFGWNAGGGIALGLYPVDLYVEVRYHAIRTTPYRTQIVPVTFGLRL